MQKGRNQKGFTLVELMVVVVIIGVLVAIAVPVYNSVTVKAEKSAIEANLRTIDGAIMTYYASVPDATAEDNQLGSIDDLEGDYLASIPEGPGTATYGIEGTAPNQRATVSSTSNVGGHKLSDGTTLDTLPWKVTQGGSSSEGN